MCKRKAFQVISVSFLNIYELFELEWKFGAAVVHVRMCEMMNGLDQLRKCIGHIWIKFFKIHGPLFSANQVQHLRNPNIWKQPSYNYQQENRKDLKNGPPEVECTLTNTHQRGNNRISEMG